MMNIRTLLDYEAVLANQEFPIHLAIQLEAPVLNASREKPIAFGLVVDRSGSMAGTPLEYARLATEMVVKNLRKNDLFSLTVFDDQAQTVVPLQSVTQQKAILKTIRNLHSGGSTNLTAGWMLGRDTLRDAGGDYAKRILLLTDGQLNVGITDPTQVKNIVAQGLEAHRVRTSCLGFGNGYLEDLLSQLATVTGGTFYDASNPDKLPGIFTDELEGLQKIAVQNLRLRLRRGAFCESVLLLSEYPLTSLSDQRVEITIGDLSSDEQRTLIMALAVNQLPLGADGQPIITLEGEELLLVEAYWDEINDVGVESKSWSQTVKVLRVQEESQVKVNSEVIPWVTAQQAGKAVQKAIELSDQGNLQEARAVLDRALQSVAHYEGRGDTSDATRILKETRSKLEAGEFDARSRKAARYSSHDYLKMSSSTPFIADDIPSYKRRRKDK